ncbi:MAG: cell division protein FtsN [Salibacteraceae bacterium]
MKKYFTLLVLFSSVSLGLFAQDEINQSSDSTKSEKEKPVRENAPPTLEIGIGTLSYFGELNNGNTLNSPLIGRLGYHMAFRQDVTPYLEFDINAWGGQLSANERSSERNLNFESTIFGVGLGFAYNFSNFLKPEPMFEPILGVGIELITFHSKTDLLSVDNASYNYWSDGSIRNIAESSPAAGDAVRIQRDYYYETDIQTSSMYDLDDYNSFAVSIPVKVGGNLHVGDKWDFRAAMTYHFTTTDLLDGVDENSGNFKGDNKMDDILYTSVSISYNFVKNEDFEDAYNDDFIDIDMNADEDEDGVIDWEDDCLETPFGAEVDEKGCPLDGDNDGVPNYGDDELASAPKAQVDSVGVTITEADAIAFYNRYYDTTGIYSPITAETYTSQVIASKVQRRGIVNKNRYAVGIGEFDGEIPLDLVNDILSVEDVNTYDKNGKIIVTVGIYDTKEEAEARQKQLQKEGVTTSDIVRVDNGKNVTKVTSEKPTFAVEEWKDSKQEEGDIVYRVQVGAFTQKADEKIFKNLSKLIQVSSDDGYVRYFTGSFNSYKNAASEKIEILAQGFKGAFVVAFRNGNRVSLNNVGTINLDKSQTAGITSAAPLSADQKNNLKFKVQLGSYRSQIPTDVLETYMELGTVEQMKGKDKYIRYVAGAFDSYEEATTYKKELLVQGFEGCYVVGVYYGKLISASQARKMLDK